MVFVLYVNINTVSRLACRVFFFKNLRIGVISLYDITYNIIESGGT